MPYKNLKQLLLPAVLHPAQTKQVAREAIFQYYVLHYINTRTEMTINLLLLNAGDSWLPGLDLSPLLPLSFTQ